MRFWISTIFSLAALILVLIEGVQSKTKQASTDFTTVALWDASEISASSFSDFFRTTAAVAFTTSLWPLRLCRRWLRRMISCNSSRDRSLSSSCSAMVGPELLQVWARCQGWLALKTGLNQRRCRIHVFGQNSHHQVKNDVQDEKLSQFFRPLPHPKKRPPAARPSCCSWLPPRDISRRPGCSCRRPRRRTRPRRPTDPWRPRGGPVVRSSKVQVQLIQRPFNALM